MGNKKIIKTPLGHWGIELTNENQITIEHFKSKKYLTGKLIDYLSELEDKLESGRLLKLPCAIHDTIYTHKKVFGKWKIEELECWGFHCDGRKILFIDCQNAKTASPNSLRAFRVEDFGKIVFTDKAQAEARLKKLQEK